jgi:hypothetical protein
MFKSALTLGGIAKIQTAALRNMNMKPNSSFAPLEDTILMTRSMEQSL